MGFYRGYVKSRAGRGKKTLGVMTKKQLRELEFEFEKVRLARMKQELELPRLAKLAAKKARRMALLKKIFIPPPTGRELMKADFKRAVKQYLR